MKGFRAGLIEGLKSEKPKKKKKKKARPLTEARIRKIIADERRMDYL